MHIGKIQDYIDALSGSLRVKEFRWKKKVVGRRGNEKKINVDFWNIASSAMTMKGRALFVTWQSRSSD